MSTATHQKVKVGQVHPNQTVFQNAQLCRLGGGVGDVFYQGDNMVQLQKKRLHNYMGVSVCVW